MSQAWWNTPLIPGLGKQHRQISEFMTSLVYTVSSRPARATLRPWIIQTRIANEKYLRTHKEVSLLISGFFREMFLKRPENILEFAAHYFTDPRLPNKIHMQLIKDKKGI
uniref:Regulatory subunit of type II PKA R-subunit (RIIa) domain containing 1 n=1 Tax=Peromyscus maniculatus bairdii TaxID=230844 RepID=A0A8C8TXY8_PERMB